jgi:hypothetical protein
MYKEEEENSREERFFVLFPREFVVVTPVLLH